MAAPATPDETERAIFVRELHDQITHALSQIHMHAAALQTIGVARGQESVQAIRAACSAATHDLRRMHAVIHDGSPAPYRPQPTLASLQELIDALRSNGTIVDFALGTCSVPPSTAAGAHRIVGEVLDQLRGAPGLTLERVDVREISGQLDLVLAIREHAASGEGIEGLQLARAVARARMLGGSFECADANAPGRSTIRFSLPLAVLP
jgi:signal transduction histidine kinase